MVRKLLNPQHLPYAGAVVQAVLFAIAGNEFFPILGWLAGLGVGAVVNYSMALASSRYSDIAEKRKPLARLAMVAMFLLSPATITLSLFIPQSVFTAISWSICVDLAIILAGAIAGKSMIGEGKAKQVAGKAKQPKGKTRQVARKAISDNELLDYFQANTEATHKEAAEYFGVTRQAIGARVKTLYAVGADQKAGK